MLTLEQLKKVFIPINVYNKPNNLKDAKSGVQLYNDSVSLYDALQLVTSTPSGGTDLANTPDGAGVTITSSTGADTTITNATTLVAGTMSPTSVTNLNSLITLSGVTGGSLNLGTFTGSVIPDNVTIKVALQALESTIGSIPIITTGNLISASTPITITNGTGSVVGSGTTITFIPSNVMLSDLGGTINFNQISITGASVNQILMFDGTDWVPTTYTPPIQDHNTLTGKQGGIASQYYHLNQSIYNKLNTATTSTVIGRGAGTGEVDLISVTDSLVLIGGELRLNNDAAVPGNNKYYGTDGTGIRGYFDATSFAGVSEVQVTDNANLDFTVTNPTTVPIITADLTDTGVAPGSYGGASTIGTFTVDEKGRLSAAANIALSITSTSISDFDEAVDDRVDNLLVAGTGITLTYDDLANTITIAAPAGTLSGTGTINQVAYFIDTDEIDSSPNFTFDGSVVTVGAPSTGAPSKITSKGIGATGLTYGYIHQNAAGTPVFTVADDGTVRIGSLAEVYINKDALQFSTAGDYPISIVGGKLTFYSDTSIDIESGGTSTTQPSLTIKAERGSNTVNQVNLQTSGEYSPTVAGSSTYTEVLIAPVINQVMSHTGVTYGIKIAPTLTASADFRGIDITASGETALRVNSGNIRFDFGSDAEGDIFYRDAAGNLVRLPVGGPTEVLGSTGTVPAWTTTAGSLPGGSNGDVLMYVSGAWSSASPMIEKQTGITGLNVTLGGTPLGMTLFMLFRNGVLQDETDDYSRVGTAVTMVTALVATDKLTIIYYT